jgi:hypothetical protein
MCLPIVGISTSIDEELASIPLSSVHGPLGNGQRLRETYLKLAAKNETYTKH